MSLPSVMSHSFSQVPQAEIQRSSFDRSHGLKTTFDAGYLVPIYVDEALPGDTFNLKMTAFARLATPLKPIMDNMYFETFFFAIPIRLIWSHWKNFMGEKVNPGDTTSYTVPYMNTPTTPGVVSGSLSDYFGIPVGLDNAVQVNSLWHRAYNLTWNEWFRSGQLQNSVTVDTGDGPDTYSNYVLLRRGKRHDYFTSGTPWPQAGPDVPLPLGSSAPIKGLGVADQTWGTTNMNVYETGGTGTVTYPYSKQVGDSAQAIRLYVKGESGGYPQIFADLSSATASTINALRQSFQLQKMYERDARGGTRYTEIIRSHFGVLSPDGRQQRPEYLGGGRSPVNVHPVAQTSVTAGTPQGNLAGFGTAAAVGHGFTKSFTEHCVLLGLANVRADLTYSQGLNRMFSRRTRFDFYWPSLSHLGEQSILNKEIYCKGDANDALTFAYQERFAEYRYKPSMITGLFRSNVSAGKSTLDYWHLSQNFTSLPSLNTTFIQDTPPVARVIAVNTEPHFLLDAFFDLKCARPMPTYSVPGLIDHF